MLKNEIVKNQTRRQLLRRGAAASASAVTTGAALALQTGCATAQALGRGEALTAQTTEGPFYLDKMANRADITEGLTGVPLDIALEVVDQSGRALSGVIVNVWHCDTNGLYSGFAGQGDNLTTNTMGKTFLRGNQIAGETGSVLFRTIYPGWYAGRTTHIHFKVSVGERAVVTSQFFLPDSLSEFLYTQLSSYKRGKLRDVLNSTDGIALSAGQTVMGSIKELKGKYVASLRIVVDPDANPRVHRPPPPGSPRPPGGPPPEFAGRGGPPPGFGGTPALKAPEGEARIKALVPS